MSWTCRWPSWKSLLRCKQRAKGALTQCSIQPHKMHCCLYYSTSTILFSTLLPVWHLPPQTELKGPRKCHAVYINCCRSNASSCIHPASEEFTTRGQCAIVTFFFLPERGKKSSFISEPARVAEHLSTHRLYILLPSTGHINKMGK